MKTYIYSFPAHENVFVCVQHRNRCGPAGGKLWRHQNPSVGWCVYYKGKKVTDQVFKSRREAQAWAEERYHISGWQKSTMSQTHHSNTHYAIAVTHPPRKRKTGEPCPICADTTGVCFHVCQHCDLIVPETTCVNGDCRNCCRCRG